MPNTNEGIKVKNPNNICVTRLTFESDSKVTIVVIDKNGLTNIKKILNQCIRMSATEGGEHRLNFSIIEPAKNRFLSLFPINNNILIMEGNLVLGLKYLKSFLPNEIYLQAVATLNTFSKDRPVKSL